MRVINYSVLLSIGAYLLEAAQPSVVQLLTTISVFAYFPTVTAFQKTAFSVYQDSNITSLNPSYITANSDGSYNVAGYKSRVGNSISNAWLQQIAANGDINWSYEESGANSLFLSSAVMDDYIYSVGSSVSAALGYFTKNHLSNGTLDRAWKLLSTSGQLIRVIPTSRHTLIFLGRRLGVAPVFMAEIDPTLGTVISAAQLTLAVGQFPTSLIVDNNGNYYMSGYTTNTPRAGWLSKLHYSANTWSQAWSNLYNNIANVQINDISIQNNNLYFSGLVANDGLIGAVNSTSGQTQWLTSLDGTGIDSLATVIVKSGKGQTSADILMATGVTSSGTQSSSNAAWYVLLNANGALQKSAIIDGLLADGNKAAIANSDGNFIAAGYAGSAGTSVRNSMLASFDENIHLDNGLLPSGLTYSDNTQNVISAAAAISCVPTTITFTPFTFPMSDITSTVTIKNTINVAWQKVELPPTSQPSGQPSALPIESPTAQPSVKPSNPSSHPSLQPTGDPSSQPSLQPTGDPSSQPSLQPAGDPSSQPSLQPTGDPSSQPSLQPAGDPSSLPSLRPVTNPSEVPTKQPLTDPSGQPSKQPNASPSKQPITSQPSALPTSHPTSAYWTPFANWTAIINQAIMNGMVLLDNETYIFSDASYTKLTATGKVATLYALPQGVTQVTAAKTVNGQLLLRGFINQTQSFLGRFNSYDRRFLWRDFASQNGQLTANTYIEASNAVIMAVYLADSNPIVLTVNADSGLLLSGNSYQIPWLQDIHINHIASARGFSGVVSAGLYRPERWVTVVRGHR